MLFKFVVIFQKLVIFQKNVQQSSKTKRKKTFLILFLISELFEKVGQKELSFFWQRRLLRNFSKS